MVPDGRAVLDAWCRLVWSCCSVDGTVLLREAACHATASALLWPTRQMTGQVTLRSDGTNVVN